MADFREQLSKAKLYSLYKKGKVKIIKKPKETLWQRIKNRLKSLKVV